MGLSGTAPESITSILKSDSFSNVAMIPLEVDDPREDEDRQEETPPKEYPVRYRPKRRAVNGIYAHIDPNAYNDYLEATRP